MFTKRINRWIYCNKTRSSLAVCVCCFRFFKTIARLRSEQNKKASMIFEIEMDILNNWCLCFPICMCVLLPFKNIIKTLKLLKPFINFFWSLILLCFLLFFYFLFLFSCFVLDFLKDFNIISKKKLLIIKYKTNNNFFRCLACFYSVVCFNNKNN